MNRRSPLLHLAAAGLIGGALFASTAIAAQPLGDQIRISAQEPDGDADFDAVDSDVARNTTTGEYLVVWEGETTVEGETEIYGQLINADGSPKGDPIRISDMGVEGSANWDAFHPAVTYNSTSNEYLVVWEADDNQIGLSPDEFEIFRQRITADGTEIGTNDLRISDLGPTNDADYDAGDPDVTYNPTTDQYLVVWSGDDDTGALVDSEDEIYVQRLNASGAEIGGDDVRVSDMGPDGDNSYDASEPAVVHNSTSNEYLVAWMGDDDVAPHVEGEHEIFVQRLSSIGVEVGTDTVVSDMGPDGDDAYDAADAAVTYNPTSKEYFVAWMGDDDTGTQVEGEFEVFFQRLSETTAELGADKRISTTGPDGDVNYVVIDPKVAHNSANNEYLVVWTSDQDANGILSSAFEIHAKRIGATGDDAGEQTRISYTGPDGDPSYSAGFPGVVYNATANEYLVNFNGADDLAPLVGGESEVYVRRVNGTTTAAAAASCATGPTFKESDSNGTFSLTTTQLKINQRIGSAAVRRANAIEDWLAAGLTGNDVCGGALTAADLDTGIATTTDALQLTIGTASPRALSIPSATDKGDVEFSLTTNQLKINQRIYSAAVRRANALKARLEGKLTGGDLKDATLSMDRLRQDHTILSLTVAASPAPASTTDVADPTDSTATFTLSTAQLKINQRIASAAVKRTNELRTLLGTGFTEDNFADGSITAVDITP